MAKYQQLTRQEVPSTEPGRQGKFDVLYVYMDPSNFRTFSFSVAKELDSADAVESKLRETVESAGKAGQAEIEIS